MSILFKYLIIDNLLDRLFGIFPKPIINSVSGRFNYNMVLPCSEVYEYYLMNGSSFLDGYFINQFNIHESYDTTFFGINDINKFEYCIITKNKISGIELVDIINAFYDDEYCVYSEIDILGY